MFATTLAGGGPIGCLGLGLAIGRPVAVYPGGGPVGGAGFGIAFGGGGAHCGLDLGTHFTIFCGSGEGGVRRLFLTEKVTGVTRRSELHVCKSDSHGSKSSNFVWSGDSPGPKIP